VSLLAQGDSEAASAGAPPVGPGIANAMPGAR
jgi:hypothetical protein